MGHYAFLILSTVAALYAAYLFTFRTYHIDYDHKPDKDRPIRCQRIVYFIAFIACFVPFVNFLLTMVFLIFAIVARDEFYVDAWLFDTPSEKEENNKDLICTR